MGAVAEDVLFGFGEGRILIRPEKCPLSSGGLV